MTHLADETSLKSTYLAFMIICTFFFKQCHRVVMFHICGRVFIYSSDHCIRNSTLSLLAILQSAVLRLMTHLLVVHILAQPNLCKNRLSLVSVHISLRFALLLQFASVVAEADINAYVFLSSQ